MRNLVMDGVHRQIASGILDLSSQAEAQAKPKPAMVIPQSGPRVGLDGLGAMRRPSSAAALPALTAMPSADLTRPGGEPSRRLRWNWAATVTAGVLLPTLVASGIIGMHQLSSLQGVAADQPTAPAVQAKTVTAPQNTLQLAHQAKLQTMLTQFAGAQGASFGIVVKDLKTGEIASTNSDRVITSASLYKLFVANAVYRGIDQGTIKIDDVVTGDASGQSVGQCLSVMINISDNACGRSLGQKVGWGKQNTLLSNAGFNHTDLSTPQKTSATDVALLLERLYRGTLLSQSSTDSFMSLLKAQRVNNRLPQGLPAGTTMAHKTGDLDGYVHDAGIVYGPKTDYLIVSTSGPWANPAVAPDAFKALSAQVYAHFNE